MLRARLDGVIRLLSPTALLLLASCASNSPRALLEAGQRAGAAEAETAPGPRLRVDPRIELGELYVTCVDLDEQERGVALLESFDYRRAKLGLTPRPERTHATIE
jgi:hypothetical protein